MRRLISCSVGSRCEEAADRLVYAPVCLVRIRVSGGEDCVRTVSPAP